MAGSAQVPTWATNNLWPETDGMGSGLKSFVDSVIIILSTGYTIGCLSAIGCVVDLKPQLTPASPTAVHFDSLIVNLAMSYTISPR